MKPFTLLIGLSALAVAGCAAFFSVTGLSLLFSGASMAVLIMGSSLEISKLVAASYLHRYWDETNKLLRTYLLGGVIILVLITSAGIFGFLSNAYQSTSLKSDVVEREISVYQSRIDQTNSELDRYNTQLNNLLKIRNSQEENISKIVENNGSTYRLTQMVKNSDVEISRISQKITPLNDSIAVWNQKINEIKNENLDLEREVGGFKFIAEAFGLPISSVVKFFIFLLIFVFDPMAVTLIIAFNNAIEKDKLKKIEKNRINNENLTTNVKNDEPIRKNSELVEKNYQIYGDGGENEVDVENNLQIDEEISSESTINENIVEINDEKQPITEETVWIAPKRPYYMDENFDWNNRKAWINDRGAIKYWMEFKNGNESKLKDIKDENVTEDSGNIPSV